MCAHHISDPINHLSPQKQAELEKLDDEDKMRRKQGQKFVIGNRLNDKFKEHIAKGRFDKDLNTSISQLEEE